MSLDRLPNLKLHPTHNARAFGRTCQGCVKTKSDIMLAFGGAEPIDLLGGNNQVLEQTPRMRIVDVFLTKKQATNLYRELGELLAEDEINLPTES